MMNIPVTLLAAINTVDLGHAFTLLWKGMLGIFVVMALIFLCTNLMNRFTKGKDD